MMLTKNLADYHVWAGERIRKPISELSEEEFTQDFAGRSIRVICEHIIMAMVWCFQLATQKKDVGVFECIETESKNQLLSRWEALDQHLAATLKEPPRGKISVPHISEEPFEMEPIDFFMQYLMHTTHHRGQLGTILRQLGKDVPGTDYIMFFAPLTK